MEISKCNKKNIISTNIKNYYGLSILKTFLSFDVINNHCFNRKSTSNKFILYLLNSNKLHVPSFIIISFYFTHNSLISFDLNKIYRRAERLFIPYLGWPFILFIMSNFVNIFSKKIPLISYKNLLYQIILGNAPNIPLHFWFLFDMIVTTSIFSFIIISMKNHYVFILLMLMIFSYYLQYSKINLYFFYSNRQPSLGKENEFIPLAVTGFILSEFNVFDKIQRNKLKSFFVSSLIYKMIQYYDIFSNFKGVQYSGIKINVCSICIIFIFSLYPIELKKRYQKVFKILTNFTGGIYYIHRIIQKYLKYTLNDIRKGTFFGIVLIYLFSYIICYLGTLIFGKTKAKYLFC